MQTQTSNTLHKAIMEAGGKDRPPMLAPDKDVPVAEGSSETTTERYMENYKNVSQDICDQLDVEAESKAIERLKQDESINVQDLETNLYWEFRKFTSRDGESLESYYSKFYKMMNELVMNQCDVTNHQVNVQANQDNSPRINKGTGYDNQMIGNVAGARETVGTTVVQKSGIQCYNCKEYGHVARECQKLKRENNAAYHKGKMLLSNSPTSVSRPQLKSNQIEDRVILNNSQGKKQEVEDHRRNVKFSKNKMSVTACNDSLNAKTLNVKFDCVTCGKCVLNDKHDICVLHSLNAVKYRTKMPMAVPISTREPKRIVNQSVTKPLRRTVALPKKIKTTISKFGEEDTYPKLSANDI
nr:hypothetical protein [Tanacetum cinerariifolium]